MSGIHTPSGAYALTQVDYLGNPIGGVSSWRYAAAAGGLLNTTSAVAIKAAETAGLKNYIHSDYSRSLGSSHRGCHPRWFCWPSPLENKDWYGRTYRRIEYSDSSRCYVLFYQYTTGSSYSHSLRNRSCLRKCPRIRRCLIFYQ
jgi:hypothetical protein